MSGFAADNAGSLVEVLLDELAERLAPRLLHIAEGEHPQASTPWLTTSEAIKYTRLPAGTFRKLSASGRIPSHGGRSKLFYRPELDRALLNFDGLATEDRALRQVG